MNWPLVCNSLLVSGASAFLAVLGGALAALWFASCAGRARGLFLAAAVVSLVLPPFLVVNCWIELLGERGIWREWLPANIYSMGGAIWTLLLLNWPISFLFVTAAWRRIQAAQLEADPRLEGRFLLRCLLLPLARTALVQSSILTFVMALNNFAVPAILQVKVFPAEVWVRFNTTFDYASAIELCWPLVLAPLVLMGSFRGGRAGGIFPGGSTMGIVSKPEHMVAICDGHRSRTIRHRPFARVFDPFRDGRDHHRVVDVALAARFVFVAAVFCSRRAAGNRADLDFQPRWHAEFLSKRGNRYSRVCRPLRCARLEHCRTRVANR